MLGLERGAEFCQPLARIVSCRLRRAHCLIRIACCTECGARFLLALSLARQPVEPGLCLRDFRLGHTPFGLDPGVIGSRLGERQFRRPCTLIGTLELGRDLRSPFLVLHQQTTGVFQLLLEPFECFGGIAGQPVCLSAILFELRLLAVEIGEALLSCLKLAGERCHAVAMRAGIVAPVCQFIARLHQPVGGFVLGLLRLVRAGLGESNLALGIFGRFACLVGSGGGIAPTGIEQPGLGKLDLLGKFLVALSLFCLPPERGHLCVETRHQVFKPGEIILGLAQFAFGIALADMQARNSCSLFKHLPSFGRFGRDYRGDLALADQCRGMRAGGCIGEY